MDGLRDVKWLQRCDERDEMLCSNCACRCEDEMSCQPVAQSAGTRMMGRWVKDLGAKLRPCGRELSVAPLKVALGAAKPSSTPIKRQRPRKGSDGS